MSDLTAIMGNCVEANSVVMTHDSGTKFYEVIGLRASQKFLDSNRSMSPNAICVTRYGTVARKDGGGTWGRGKLLNGYGVAAERYMNKVISSKQSGGYQVDVTLDSDLGERLIKLGFFGRNDNAIDVFLRQFGITSEMIQEHMAGNAAPLSAPPIIAAPEVIRSPLYGSWS